MIVSLKDGSRKILSDIKLPIIPELTHYTVSGRNIIYTDGYRICKINVDTMTEDVIFKLDLSEQELTSLYSDKSENINKKYKSFMNSLTMPHVTNDGKYVSFFQLFVNYDSEEPSGYIPEKHAICYVVEIDTKKVCYTFKKRFLGSAWIANHFSINPNNHNLVAFSHEGDSSLIPNRIWFYDNCTGKMYNAAKQKMTEDMDLGEFYGHEIWSPSGEGMYFVKFRDSIIKPQGIVYFDRKSSSQETLYTKFDYLHVSASNDEKYLVADTFMDPNTMKCDIVFIDQEKKVETIVDRVRVECSHPCHAHPVLAPDNSKISYTMMQENGDIAVRIAFLKV